MLKNAGTINAIIKQPTANTYDSGGAQYQAASANTGLNSGAWQAAKIAGGSLGVDPNVLYGQFKGETGNFTNTGAKQNNFASIMPGGKMASYSSPSDFASAFVGQITKNYPNAVGTGSDVKSYVAGLTNGRIGTYYANPAGMPPETQADYTNMVASNMPNTQITNYGAQLTANATGSTVTAPNGQVMQPNPGGTVANPSAKNSNLMSQFQNWVGSNVGNFLLVLVGGALILGALFLGYKQAPKIIESIKK